MKECLHIGFVVVMLVAIASVSLGGSLEDGIAAAQAGDFQKAHELWLFAANQGNALAQTNLGALYAKGRGVPQDDLQAAKWFRLAAAQGEAKAQANLGVFYAKGRGVAQDDKEAAKWFHLAAMQGDATAQFSLGVMYDVGRGVVQNYVVACAWYVLATENGEAAAQSFMDATQQKMTPNEIEMSRQIAEQIRTEIGH